MLAMLLWFAMFLFFIRLGFAADIKTAWDASAGGLLATKSKLALTWELPGRSPGMQAAALLLPGMERLIPASCFSGPPLTIKAKKSSDMKLGHGTMDHGNPPANPTGLGLK